MDYDQAVAILRTGAGMFERQAEATAVVLAYLDAVERRAQQVRDGSAHGLPVGAWTPVEAVDYVMGVEA